MGRHPSLRRIGECSAIAFDPAWLDPLHESVRRRGDEREAVLEDHPTGERARRRLATADLVAREAPTLHDDERADGIDVADALPRNPACGAVNTGQQNQASGRESRSGRRESYSRPEITPLAGPHSQLATPSKITAEFPAASPIAWTASALRAALGVGAVASGIDPTEAAEEAICARRCLRDIVGVFFSPECSTRR
jgi:hypothetical protein